MTRTTLKVLVALALSSTVAGCGTDSSLFGLDADKELMLSAVSNEREALTQGEDQLGSAPDQAEPDQPRLDGDCDVAGHFEQIFSRYDEDASGELEEPEEMDVEAERDHRADHERMRRMQAWIALEATYDADDSGVLEEAERDALLADFTTRCEVLHARVLADFDADGDGELSEEEAAEARAELESRRAEHRAEGGPEGEGGERPEGEMDGERPDGPPSPEEMRERFEQQWDFDGDGVVSDEERELGRAEMQLRIVSGAPLGPEGRCQGGEEGGAEG